MSSLRFQTPVMTMQWTKRALACATALCLSACGVHQSEAPGLSGPSELALSVSMSASPDSITQDGRSNSTITLSARDADGRAVVGTAFRLDMMVDNQIGDYGTLSTRNVTTGSDGRATATYTAPPAPPVGSTIATCPGNAASGPTVGRCVQVTATNAGTDYSSSATHTVQLHLMPTGVIISPSSIPLATFTALPESPSANTPAQFDGSKSCPGTDGSGNCSSVGAIIAYAWSFGDGGSASGARTSHTFTREGTFMVTLTVTNDLGVSNSLSQYVQVGAGAAPTALFIYSPKTPAPKDQVNFDANQSKPGAGHNIVRFVWNWGDGTPFTDTGSPSTSHTFDKAGTYAVLLTVIDESGQSGTLEIDLKIGTSGP